MHYRLKNRLTTIFLAFNMLAIPLWAGEKFAFEIYTDSDEISMEVTDHGYKYSLDNGYHLELDGAPEIPYKIIRLALPVNGNIKSVSAVGSKSKRIAQGVNHSWFEGDIKTTLDEVYMPAPKNAEIYNSEDIFPGKYIELLNEGFSGSQHLAVIAVYPLQYRPARGELILVSEIDIQIEFEDQSTALLGPSPQGASQVRAMLDNAADFAPPSGNPTTLGGGDIPGEIILGIGAEYLIITSGPIAPAFYPYAVWKNQKGLLTELVLIEDILQTYPGEDPPAQLREYLKQAYIEGARWVLLGGDEDIIPVRYAYPGNVNNYEPGLDVQQVCDLYYADLSGDWDYDGDGIYGEYSHDQPDIFPEVYVGRVPAVNLAEAEAWVEKALLYEQNPGNGDYAHLARGLFIVADQMRDLNQHVSLANLMPESFEADITRCAEEPSGGSTNPTQPTAERVVEVMNEGWGFISNLNHGTSYCYSTMAPGYNYAPRSYLWGDYIDPYNYAGALIELDESDKYSIHYSISCGTAAYDFDQGIFGPGPYPTENTFMEVFLLEPNRGGVAYLGNTRWGWVTRSFRLETKFIEYVFTDSARHLAVAEALSKIYYSSYRDINYGHSLFGDPEMEIWAGIPRPLNVNVPEEIDIDWNSITVSVSLPEGPAADVKVCVWKPGELYYRGFTNASGELDVPLDLAFEGQMYVTADGQDLVPDIDTVFVHTYLNIDDKPILPGEVHLGRNYPNPFNSSTDIPFANGDEGHLTIEIFDIGGRKVATVADNIFPPGHHNINWDAKNSSGQPVASGTYFYRLQTDNKNVVKKMVLLK